MGRLQAVLVTPFLPAVCWLLLTVPETAAGAGANTAVYQIRLAHQPPPCTEPRGMPITPNDPGALTTPGGRRCYGTQPPQLQLRLPHDRYVWLERGSGNPAAWIKAGSVLVDVRGLEEPPLGLRLTGAGEVPALETRYADAATLTHLEPGRWREIRAADGARFWAYLEADGNGQALSRSSAETATPLRSQ